VYSRPFIAIWAYLTVIDHVSQASRADLYLFRGSRNTVSTRSSGRPRGRRSANESSGVENHTGLFDAAKTCSFRLGLCRRPEPSQRARMNRYRPRLRHAGFLFRVNSNDAAFGNGSSRRIPDRSLIRPDVDWHSSTDRLAAVQRINASDRGCIETSLASGSPATQDALTYALQRCCRAALRASWKHRVRLACQGDYHVLCDGSTAE